MAKNKEFSLSAEDILSNYNKLITWCEKFNGRGDKLKAMYADLGEERIMFAPASGTNYFHNAIPGGYVDHILRVMKFAKSEYEHYQSLGVNVENFTLTELLFAAMHHDLGKLGFPGEGKELYLPNQSDWHKTNQGKIYEYNDAIPHGLIQDRSLFLLQNYGITTTWNEWLAIRIHDGLYDKANEAYYMSHSQRSRMRSMMPQILHNADLAASRWEFERWNTSTNSLNLENVATSKVTAPIAKTTKKAAPKVDLSSSFTDLFKN